MAIETLISAVKAWGERTFASRAEVAGSIREVESYVSDSVANVNSDVASVSKKVSQVESAVAEVQELAVETDREVTSLKSSALRLDDLFPSTTKTYTWTGATSGLEQFTLDGVAYYKVSDDVFEFSDVESVDTRHNTGSMNINLYSGDGCFCAGYSIVVNNAGECSLKPMSTSLSPVAFTVPSTGIYFQRKGASTYTKKATYKLRKRVDIVELEARVAAIESTPNAEGVAF